MRKVKVSGAIVYLVVLLVVILLYIVYIFNPMLSKSAEINTQNTADKQLISNYTVQLASLKNLKQNVSDLSNKVSKAAASSDFSSIQVWNDVNSGLTGTGVETQSATVGDGAEVKGAKKSATGKTKMSVDVSLTLNCTEPQTEALIHYFEKESKAVYHVNSVQLTKTDLKNQGQVQKAPFNSVISLSMYYYSAPAKKAASDSGAVSTAASPASK